MGKLSDGMDEHSRKLETEAAARAAKAAEEQAKIKTVSEAFTVCLLNTIGPAYQAFKTLLKKHGKDCEVFNSHKSAPLQLKAVILHDAQLAPTQSRVEKTIEPAKDIAQDRNARFFEIHRVHGTITLRYRAQRNGTDKSQEVALETLTTEFVEEELLKFYKEAFPTTG